MHTRSADGTGSETRPQGSVGRRLWPALLLALGLLAGIAVLPLQAAGEAFAVTAYCFDDSTDRFTLRFDHTGGGVFAAAYSVDNGAEVSLGALAPGQSITVTDVPLSGANVQIRLFIETSPGVFDLQGGTKVFQSGDAPACASAPPGANYILVDAFHDLLPFSTLAATGRGVEDVAGIGGITITVAPFAGTISAPVIAAPVLTTTTDVNGRAYIAFQPGGKTAVCRLTQQMGWRRSVLYRCWLFQQSSGVGNAPFGFFRPALAPLRLCTYRQYPADGQSWALFSATMTETVAVTVPVGVGNFFDGPQSDVGQTTVFSPTAGMAAPPSARQTLPFWTSFAGASLSWSLAHPETGLGGVATASAGDNDCPPGVNPVGHFTATVVVSGTAPSVAWSLADPKTGTLTSIAAAGGSAVFAVTPGTYSLTLPIPAGYALSDMACANAGVSDGVTAHFTTTPGSKAGCVFYVDEVARAALRVALAAAGKAAPVDWTVGGSVGDGTIPSAGGEFLFANVAPGVYSVTVTAQPYFPLTGECNGVPVVDGHISLSLASGVESRCVMTATFTPVVTVSARRTLGLDPGHCGVAAQLGVQPGSLVYGCLLLRNAGAFPLHRHVIADALTGAALVVTYTLAPGEELALTPATLSLFGIEAGWRLTVTEDFWLSDDVTALYIDSTSAGEVAGAATAEALYASPTVTTTASVYRDSDLDTLPDAVEGDLDVDEDGIPNYLDEDSDGDLVSDRLEAGADPWHPADGDGNSRPDYLEGAPTGLAGGDEPVVERIRLFLPITNR